MSVPFRYISMFYLQERRAEAKKQREEKLEKWFGLPKPFGINGVVAGEGIHFNELC